MKTRKCRSRVCDTCGRVDVVRADYDSSRCITCSSRANGRAAGKKSKGFARPQAGLPPRPRIYARCPQCGKSFPTTNFTIRKTKVHCCSRECRRLYCGAERTCKSCGLQFRALKSQIKGITRSNSSANFCSRKCYNGWLCKPDRVSGRGSQWNRVRRAVIARSPFCAICGTQKRLDVHHIVPFRITHDNRPINLIPLCKKCHKRVESLLNDVVLTGIEPPTLLLAFRSMLVERQLATLTKIREVLRNARSLQTETRMA